MTSGGSKDLIRLYRFFNVDKTEHGSLFAMCDYHYVDYIKPNNCLMERLANEALWECDLCREEKENSRK